MTEATATVAGILVGQLPTLLTKRHMAELLERHVRTIYRLESQGKLPSSVNIGSQRVWSLDEVQNWIAAGCPPRRDWEKRYPKYRKKGH